MTRFRLWIYHYLVGEFVSPMEINTDYWYYCQHCGVIVARRILVIQPTPPLNFYTPCTCELCAQKYKLSPYEFQEFRLPGEVIRGFQPIEILAQELLFNLRVYEQETADGKYSIRQRTY